MSATWETRTGRTHAVTSTAGIVRSEKGNSGLADSPSQHAQPVVSRRPVYAITWVLLRGWRNLRIEFPHQEPQPDRPVLCGSHAPTGRLLRITPSPIAEHFPIILS